MERIQFCFFFKIFIYLFGRESASWGSGRKGEGWGGFPLSGEPDAGLDLGTLGS